VLTGECKQDDIKIKMIEEILEITKLDWELEMGKVVNIERLKELAKTKTTAEMAVITNETKAKIYAICKKHKIEVQHNEAKPTTVKERAETRRHQQDVFNEFLKTNKGVRS
jgi:ABC-type enterochelin transport system substrate-binding protein